MKIYTKTGDSGDTRLFNGAQVRKDDDRVDTYGEVDELHAFIGAAASFLKDPALLSMLTAVQKDLFSIGAQLADPGFKGQSRAKFQLPPSESPRWRMQLIVSKRNCPRCVNSSWRVEDIAGPCFMWHEPFAGARSAGS